MGIPPEKPKLEGKMLPQEIKVLVSAGGEDKSLSPGIDLVSTPTSKDVSDPAVAQRLEELELEVKLQDKQIQLLHKHEKQVEAKKAIKLKQLEPRADWSILAWSIYSYWIDPSDSSPICFWCA